MRRFLHDVVCLSLSFSYETCVRREYVCIPNPLDLVYTYKFLQKYLLDPRDLLLDDDALAFLCRNPLCNIVPNLIESSLMGKIQDQFVSTYVLGVVHANVGKNVTPHNPSLGLFLYHFLHTMSL